MDQAALLKKMEELEERVKRAERGEDYRQILNVIAAHSFCYNAHQQQYEIDNYWTKTKEDCFYNGNTTPIGVETYYVNNTRRLRNLQREIVRSVYGKDIPDDAAVGYRVMNMLTTPFVEIAQDGLTAQGIWFTFNIMSHLDEKGVPQPTVNAGKTCAEFVKENGEWRLWRFRGCPNGFDLDVNLKNTGLDEESDDEGRKRMAFGTPKPTEEESRLMHHRDLKGDMFNPEVMRYTPWNPTMNDPPLPKPYDTYEDTIPFFVFADEEPK